MKIIDTILKQNIQFSIDLDSSLTTTSNYYEYIWAYICPSYADQKLIDISRFLANQLETFANQPEYAAMRPRDVRHYSLLRTGKILAERLKKKSIFSQEMIKDFLMKYMAVRLCIQANVFTNNPGFFEFSMNYNLDQLMAEYDHTIRTTISGDVLLLVEGEEIPWPMIKEYTTLLGNGGGRYSYRGIQSVGFTNWQKIPVHKIGNPEEWSYKYVFEICIKHAERPRGLGDHAWFRLKTPQGEIYSIGMSSDKNLGSESLFHALQPRKAFLISPDFNEFSSDADVINLPIEISEDQFKLLLHAIETDKSSDQLVFQIFCSNCTTYIFQRIFPLISSQDIDCGYLYPYILIPMLFDYLNLTPLIENRLTQISSVFDHKKLEELSRCKLLARKVTALFLNGFSLFFGAAQKATTVKTQENYIIDSIENLFELKRAIFHHPHAYGKLLRTVRQKIDKEAPYAMNYPLPFEVAIRLLSR